MSNLGNVRGRYLRGGKYMTVHLNRDGRPRVKLARRWFNLHQIVCRAFHGEAPAGKPNVLHWDDDPFNNEVGNLRWGSVQDNAKDRVRNGRQSYHDPESLSFAKLNWEKVREMRSLYAIGYRQCDLADHFQVSRPTVNQIVHRRTWNK